MESKNKTSGKKIPEIKQKVSSLLNSAKKEIPNQDSIENTRKTTSNLLMTIRSRTGKKTAETLAAILSKAIQELGPNEKFELFKYYKKIPIGNNRETLHANNVQLALQRAGEDKNAINTVSKFEADGKVVMQIVDKIATKSGVKLGTVQWDSIAICFHRDWLELQEECMTFDAPPIVDYCKSILVASSFDNALYYLKTRIVLAIAFLEEARKNKALKVNPDASDLSDEMTAEDGAFTIDQAYTGGRFMDIKILSLNSEYKKNKNENMRKMIYRCGLDVIETAISFDINVAKPDGKAFSFNKENNDIYYMALKGLRDLWRSARINVNGGNKSGRVDANVESLRTIEDITKMDKLF